MVELEMKITLISSEERPGIKEIKKELEKKGAEVEIWDIGKSKKIPESDKFVFLGFGSLDQKVIEEKRTREEERERLKLLKKIPKSKMYNRIIPLEKDKQYWFLKLRGLPTLKTRFTRDIEKALNKRKKGKKVLKPTEGSLGQGIIFPDVEDKKAREEIELSRKGIFVQPSYYHKIAIQDYVEGNEVLKVILLGDDYYSVKYTYPNKNRELIRGKVKIEKAELTKEEKKIIEKVKKRTKTNFLGIDLIRTEKGSKILELNISPNLSKIKKEYPSIYSKMSRELVKKKKGNFYEKVLSKMRKRRR